MSLRDRIARVLCATSPANTEGSAFEDYAECNQREWLETADAILSDPEIAALVRVGDFCLDTMFVPDDGGDAFRCAFCGCGERPVQFRPDFVHARNCALARLEEARK